MYLRAKDRSTSQDGQPSIEAEGSAKSPASSRGEQAGRIQAQNRLTAHLSDIFHSSSNLCPITFLDVSWNPNFDDEKFIIFVTRMHTGTHSLRRMFPPSSPGGTNLPFDRGWIRGHGRPWAGWFCWLHRASAHAIEPSHTADDLWGFAQNESCPPLPNDAGWEWRHPTPLRPVQC